MMDIKEMIKDIHENAKEKGWWEDDRTFGEHVALFHSELSEALEEYRKGKGVDEIYTDEKGKPCGIPIELADCIIRIFDFCGRYGIDISAAIARKHTYNKLRPYRHGNKVL